MEEIFKPIPGYKGYWISNLGRVQSTKRQEPIIMSLNKTRLGYVIAQFWNPKKNNIETKQVNRLVLEAFVGYPAEPWLCYAHHIDGDLSNCKLDNLEWIICETTDEYDPKKSHRRGVLKPRQTKDRMTGAKLQQSQETINKAQIARLRTMQIRYGFKLRKDYE